jgi:predicted dehydrogenase
MVAADSSEPAPVRLLGGAIAPGESPDVVTGKSPFQTELEHFIRCAATGEESIVDARDAREALRIGLAATESVVTGRPITLGRFG